MPDLRDPRVEEKRCLELHGTWEGARPDELSFQLCSDSSLGGLGKVLKGLFTEQGKKSLRWGMRPPCPSISS